jgi:hypothetical protein
MWFWPVNRMFFRPGLLWLALNLALIIQGLSRNVFFFFQFYIPRKKFLLIPVVSRTQVEDGCCRI